MPGKQLYWKTRFARWPSPPAHTGGYTLLMPVPGDLPVFLELALRVCRLQTAAHRVETFVIPDTPTQAVADAVDRAVADWNGPLALLPLRALENRVLPRLGEPTRNYGCQIIRGLTKSSGSYAIFHDADLFLPDPGTHDAQYAEAVSRDLDVLGVDRSWDPWFAAHDMELAATWEMCVRRGWATSFPPHELLGRNGTVAGEERNFDVTFWAQTQTAPARIAVSQEHRILHFNYVIGTYRNFARSTGPFVDEAFRLLLIRIFVDMFSDHPAPVGLPTLDELASGLRGEHGRVGYEGVDPALYLAFRDKLTAVIAGPWGDEQARARTFDALLPFDEHFGFDPAVTRTAE